MTCRSWAGVDFWSPSSWPVINSVSGYTVSSGLKLLAVRTQDGEPQYTALVQPSTCRLHEDAALLTDVAYCFFSVIFFIAFIQACNSTAEITPYPVSNQLSH